MNKTEFIRELQKELGNGTTSLETERVLDAVLNSISRTVRRRGLVKFRGFGSFSLKTRKARVVRHPANGGRLFVQESQAMRFHPSGQLWRQ